MIVSLLLIMAWKVLCEAGKDNGNSPYKSCESWERIRAKQREFQKKYFASKEEWELVINKGENSPFPEIQELYKTKYDNAKKELTEVIGVEPTTRMITYGVLAKEGKLPYELGSPSSDKPYWAGNPHYSGGDPFKLLFSFREFAYSFDGAIVYGEAVTHKRRLAEIEKIERMDYALKYWQWYDKTLRENGMEEKMLYSRKVISSNVNIKPYITKPLGSVEEMSSETDLTDVFIYWEPFIEVARDSVLKSY